MRTWLITGSSSGLGLALGKAVVKAGDRVVATARDTARLGEIGALDPERVLCLSLDVRDPAQIVATVTAAMARFGRIDVLVNNAGHGYRAAVEEGDATEVRDLFETNFHGPVALIQAVLPAMRQRRSGHIVNVSSIVGRFARPGSGYYSATKFALEGLSDALRGEVEPLGIAVTLVEPGQFRTDFAGRSLQQSATKIGDYDLTAGPRRKENDRTHGTQPGDPARAAEAILTAVASETPPFRLALGSDALRLIGAELEAQADELAAWAPLSATTDFPQ
ncbi:oxidoreductase [Alterinioella nitratireducens]|uniref:oxidoreductase n=1 Tax=Alterinioella nitratireducens TaxID=2735915 RepID=UPI001556379B|nr:oxidoreductase [Alterinioella nitratireducens]NPD21483.1 SDR family NAD(P)-dependent oxidoreductase [Alterinioella nitratireducens]